MAVIYTYTNYIPLISIFLIIISSTILKQFYSGFNVMNAMQDFMGIFFIVFSIFKIINIKGFAEAYSQYDIIAKNFFAYGYIYPFIELGLGIAYLMRWNPLITNSITAGIMLVSSIGVVQQLLKKNVLTCACLGAVFKIPMTYVTLLEDLLMAVMAIITLIFYSK
jgi:hypothetical protein